MKELRERIEYLTRKSEEIEKELKETKQRFDELVEDGPLWRPIEEYQKYYSVGGGLRENKFWKEPSDFRLMESDFVFPTRNQAESYILWYEAFVRLVRLIAEINIMHPQNGDYKYMFFYDTVEGGVGFYATNRLYLSMLMVDSREGADYLYENYDDLFAQVFRGPWEK